MPVLRFQRPFAGHNSISRYQRQQSCLCLSAVSYSSCSFTQLMTPSTSLRSLGVRSSQLKAPISASKADGLSVDDEGTHRPRRTHPFFDRDGEQPSRPNCRFCFRDADRRGKVTVRLIAVFCAKARRTRDLKKLRNVAIKRASDARGPSGWNRGRDGPENLPAPAPRAPPGSASRPGAPRGSRGRRRGCAGCSGAPGEPSLPSIARGAAGGGPSAAERVPSG
jgi:hypothetical protein